MEVRVAEVAEVLGGQVVGDADLVLTGISSLTEAEPGDISFLANPKYAPYLNETRAACVLVGSEQANCPVVQIVVDNPDFAFAKVVEAFGPKPHRLPIGVHPSAVIGDNVTLGEAISVGPYAVIDSGSTIGAGSVVHAHAYIAGNVTMGENCLIHPHVTVREGCQLGDRVIVHSGAVVGSDGFGYASVEGVHHKIPQVGIVEVGDDVEIGANTTIDRARFGVTKIGAGTKIDNLVQIAHNVEIGSHTIIVAQTGIAGSTKVGNYVTLAGQSGIAGHISIGDQAIIAGKAGVSKNIPAKALVAGHPAVDMRTHQAKEISIRRLPKALAELKALNDRIAALEQSLSSEEPSA